MVEETNDNNPVQVNYESSNSELNVSDSCPANPNWKHWSKNEMEINDVDKNIKCYNIAGLDRFIVTTPLDLLDEDIQNTLNKTDNNVYECEDYGIVDCSERSEDNCNGSGCEWTDDKCQYNEANDIFSEYRNQCSNIPHSHKKTTGSNKNERVPTWYSSQKEANPQGKFGSKFSKHQTENGSWINHHDLRKLWKRKISGISFKDIDEFIHAIGGHEVLHRFTTEGTKQDRVKKLKEIINSKRGSNIQCKNKDGSFKIPGTGWAKCSNTVMIPDPDDPNSKISVASFGPEDIIIEEVRDWYDREVIRNGPDEGSGPVPRSHFFLPEYENCMNELLHTGENNEEEILTRIKNHKSISNWTSSDMGYLVRKMKKFASINPEDAHGCMELLEIGNQMNNELCKSGMTTQMNQISHLIIRVMGFSLDIEDIKVDSPEHRKLKRFIDEIIPIIPHVIKNILDISEYYEKRNCPSGKNINTELLKRVYDDLFNQSNYVFDFNISHNFDDVKNMPIYEILKIALIVLVSTYVISMIMHSLVELIGVFKSIPINK